MSFYGMDFDLEEVTPLHHSRAMVSDNPYPKIGNGMAVTILGMTLTVAAGYGIFMGKYIYNDAPYTITVPNSFSGVLAFKFDLTQTNTATGTGSSRVVTNNQLSLVLQPVATFPIVWNSLGDINNGDSIGYCPIGKVSSTTTTVTYTSYFNNIGTFTSIYASSWTVDTWNSPTFTRINDNISVCQTNSTGGTTAGSREMNIPLGFDTLQSLTSTQRIMYVRPDSSSSSSVIYFQIIPHTGVYLTTNTAITGVMYNIFYPTDAPFYIY
ncbi:MAG: hypothetical protein LBT10_01885 [Methanobrevibacter sp.]|jgi:hypothetical protein|nr:hypothetical protein [Methanobrevibacter sp.]